jgi:oligopeptide transport system permease protein
MMARLLSGLLTLWLVATVTFGLMRLLPGGPFDRDRKVPPAVQAALEERYHLNDSLPVQYGYYLKGLLQGDLGPSYKYQSRRVNDIVADAAGIPAVIGGLALVVGTLVGVLLGTLAGLFPRFQSWLSLPGMVALSTPSFIVGGVLMLVFALWLGWLPVATLQSPAHFVLPVLTLSWVPLAFALMLIQTSIQEVKRQGYIGIKRAYGLSEWRIALAHILRNALLPLLSLMGPLAAALLTGSFAVEYIFAIPGLGRHFINAVTDRDYTLVMGITLLYSALLIVLNTLSDWLVARLNPRLR